MTLNDLFTLATPTYTQPTGRHAKPYDEIAEINAGIRSRQWYRDDRFQPKHRADVEEQA